MSFFEPRLKPLPDAFYSEGDASPVRSKVLRRSPTWPGYVPYKLLELVDGGSEVNPICEDPIIPLWPSTDDELELETDVGQEKTESETWNATADPKISMETQIQARKDEPAVKQEDLSWFDNHWNGGTEASSKVQVSLEAALSPSTSFGPNGPSLTMLPLEHRPRSDPPLDGNSFRPEKVQNFGCVSRGMLSGYVCPQYATQHHMQQSAIKEVNYEAFAPKPVAPKLRSGHEKHGTENRTPGSSKKVGLQQPAGTAPKSIEPLDNEQTAKARRVGDAAKKKAREIGQERVKEKAMGPMGPMGSRPMMPAVDHLKPRHASHALHRAPAAYGRANGPQRWMDSCKA